MAETTTKRHLGGCNQRHEKMTYQLFFACSHQLLLVFELLVRHPRKQVHGLHAFLMLNNVLPSDRKRNNSTSEK